MGYERFLDETIAQGGFSSREAAAAAIADTLQILAEVLFPAEAALLAADLPAELAHLLRRVGPSSGPHPVEVYERMAARRGIRAGVAKEEIEVVLRALSAWLDPDTREQLRRALPPAMAAPFEVAPPAGPPPQVTRPPGGTTLASGRPGSEHPLSEARPDRAQRESVVRATNPHGDIKLSSSAGIAEERRGDTIATGTPGSKVPISTG